MSSEHNESLQWFQKYQSVIEQTIRSKINRANAYFELEDVVQEVWFKFHKMKPGYLSEMPEVERKRVVITTVNNVIIDMRRKESALTRTQLKHRQDYLEGTTSYLKEHGQHPTNAQMAEYLGWPLSRVIESRESQYWEADCGGTFEGLADSYIELTNIDHFLERVYVVAGMLLPAEEYIFLQTEMENKSNKEIAAAMGVSAPRVSQVRKRALAKFMALFKAE